MARRKVIVRNKGMVKIEAIMRSKGMVEREIV